MSITMSMRDCQQAFIRGFAFLLLLLSGAVSSVKAQVFSPIPITGFNKDVVAESGTSSVATTDICIDGITSNKVMYTNAFKTTNAIGGGGIADNGTFVTGTTTFQMAPYNGPNCLLLQRGQTGTISLAAAAGKFSALRVLILATEGTALVNVNLLFADGTTTTALTNYSVSDWFNGTTNLVVSGIGRCSRVTTAPYDADGYTTNPRMYYMPITLSCADKQKTLAKITFSNVTTAGNNAPYPNLCVLGLSGVAFAQTVTPTVTDASCSAATGTASVAVTGSAAPFTYSWNTTPVQTTPTITNLAPRSYTVTITDNVACATNQTVTVALVNNLTLDLHRDTLLCTGGSFNAATVSNATGFRWTPTTGLSSSTIANPVITPAVTTTYSVLATLGTCSLTKTFTATVSQTIVASAGPDVRILTGGSTQLQGSSNVAGTYVWTPPTGLSSTSILQPIASPAQTTTYNLTVSTAQGCSVTKSVTVTVVPYCIKPMEAFTPNGDGINDVWLITNGNCLEYASVKVFNRYGAPVFESKDYKNNWDGMYKSKPVADGTYYYVITYKLFTGDVQFLKGNLTILR